MIALNNSESADSAAFGTDSPDTAFTEIYPGDGPALAADGNGQVTVDVPALGVRVFRADAHIPAHAGVIPVSLDSPAEGTEVLLTVSWAAGVKERVPNTTKLPPDTSTGAETTTEELTTVPRATTGRSVATGAVGAAVGVDVGAVEGCALGAMEGSAVGLPQGKSDSRTSGPQ